MKKNRASCAGQRWIGIVPNLDEPVISKIARAHFFVSVIIWRILGVDYNVAVVVRRTRVIAPNVRLGHLMVWIVAAGGQMRIVSKNLTNLENAGGRATVALFLSKTWLVLPREPNSPGEPAFSKQDRKRSSDPGPITATRSLKQSDVAAHGIPRWGNPQD